ncbi:nitrous oxide reductase accessory protein NosL [Nitratifractor sp.]
MSEFKKIFFILSALGMLLGFVGCGQSRERGGVEAIHWDRDMCERCKMVVSERKYAAEVVNPKTNKVYKFDDLGCATLWLKEEKIPWAKEARIWVTDAKTGAWLDARKALYTDDSITPMAYGIAAYSEKTFPKGHKVLHFDEAVKIIEKIEAKNTQLRKAVP